MRRGTWESFPTHQDTASTLPSKRGTGATRKVAPVFLSALFLSACVGGATASEAPRESPLARQPGASGQPFPDAAQGNGDGWIPTPTATRPSAVPSRGASASSIPPSPSVVPAPSLAPSPEQGAKGGGAFPNTCSARFQQNGNKLAVHLVTDIDPPSFFYGGYLADDKNGDAIAKLWRGTDFTVPYTGEPVVLLAVDARTLPPGTLTGPSGTIPAGVPYEFTWCGTYS